MTARVRRRWHDWASAHPSAARFMVFFVLSNGVTVLQLALMPVLKAWFGGSGLVDVPFQAVPLGTGADGRQVHLFDYAPGPLPHGGGGLAYFLAVQISVLVAQVINFVLQRRVTFRSTTGVWSAAAWYALAYALITVGAAALQLLYKAPVYTFFMVTLAWGDLGGAVADVTTMLVNSVVSFWVFYPILGLIFGRGAGRTSGG